MVHEVWPTNAEVQDIDLLQDGIVEGIQEPGSVGHLRGILLINIILIHCLRSVKKSFQLHNDRHSEGSLYPMKYVDRAKIIHYSTTFIEPLNNLFTEKFNNFAKKEQIIII